MLRLRNVSIGPTGSVAPEGRECLGLERAGGAAEDVLDGFGARVQTGLPRVAPQGHLGESALQRTQHVIPKLRIGGDHAGRDRERQRARRGRRIIVGLVAVGAQPEDLQRADVTGSGEDHGDVPAGHRAVEQPAARGSHDVADVERRDVQLVLAEAARGDSRPAGTRRACLAAVVGLKRLSAHGIALLSVLVRILRRGLPAQCSVTVLRRSVKCRC